MIVTVWAKAVEGYCYSLMIYGDVKKNPMWAWQMLEPKKFGTDLQQILTLSSDGTVKAWP